MKKLVRLIYILYYLKKMDWKRLHKFSHHVSVKHNIPKYSLYTMMFKDSWVHNISLLEFFQFEFYRLSDEEKNKWAGTGFMYEYQLKMNPKKYRNLLANKVEFLEYYKQCIKRNFFHLLSSHQSDTHIDKLIKSHTGKVVLKNSKGGCGIGIEVIETSSLTKKSLLKKMKGSGNDLAEEYIEQHVDLNNLSPSGVNTIRIITQINSRGKVDILGCRLRISVNSEVDNMAAGNLVASIDLATGIVNSTAVYSDISKNEVNVHPVTNVPIKGFQVPFWKEAISMVKKAALLGSQNRSVGWDVAITNEGPELIEGNHDWCKLVWQLPVKKGLKSVLETYLNNNDYSTSSTSKSR